MDKEKAFLLESKLWIKLGEERERESTLKCRDTCKLDATPMAPLCFFLFFYSFLFYFWYTSSRCGWFCFIFIFFLILFWVGGCEPAISTILVRRNAICPGLSFIYRVSDFYIFYGVFVLPARSLHFIVMVCSLLFLKILFIRICSICFIINSVFKLQFLNSSLQR